jgi:hypothetical protein
MAMIIPDIRGAEPVAWHRIPDVGHRAVAIRVHNGHVPDGGWSGGARRASIWQAGIPITGLIQELRPDRPIEDQAEDLVALLDAIYPGDFLVGRITRGLSLSGAGTRERWEMWRAYVNKRLGYDGYRGAWLMTDTGTRGLDDVIADPDVPTWIIRHTVDEPGLPYDLWQFAGDHVQGTSPFDVAGRSLWRGCAHQLAERIGGVSL